MIYRSKVVDGKLVLDVDLPDGLYDIKITKPKRTKRQNRALHLYLKHIAEELNSAGRYVNRNFFKEGIDIEWTPKMVKNLVWRTIQIAMTKKYSTTEITTKELTQIALTIRQNLALKFGIDLDFPSFDVLDYQHNRKLAKN